MVKMDISSNNNSNSILSESTSNSILEQVIMADDLTADMSFAFLRRDPVVEHIALTDIDYSADKASKIEFCFDRSFKSTMFTPDHLTFMSILPVFQKIYYYYFMDRRGASSFAGDETLKIWPISLNIKIPKLITKKAGLKGVMEEYALRDLGFQSDELYSNARKYITSSSMKIEDSMEIDVKALIYELAGSSA